MSSPVIPFVEGRKHLNGQKIDFQQVDGMKYEKKVLYL